MKVYSPSQTTSWLECPLKRQYQQLGYRKREVDKRIVSAAIGTVLHHAFDVFNTTGSLTQAENALTEIIEATPLGPVFSWLDYELPLRKVLQKLAKDVSWELYGWHTCGGSIRLGEEYGNCEFDHVIASGETKTFNDFKTSWEKKDHWQIKFWQEIKDSWQMAHYVWAWEQCHQTQLDKFGITLVVCTPKPKVEFREIPVNRTLVERFTKSAPVHWARMQMDEFMYQTVPSYRSAVTDQHHGRYGECEFYDACFLYNGDYELMQVGYEKIERRRDASQE